VIDLKWQIKNRPDGDIDVYLYGADAPAQHIRVKVPPGASADEFVRDLMRSIHKDSELVANKSLRRVQARIRNLRANLDRTGERASPPALAEMFISMLAPKNSAQAQLGDLQEMFEANVERLGEREARRKYWMQVANSFGPLLWQWMKRLGFFTVLVDYFRSKLGL
jgi:hypothetical protein